METEYSLRSSIIRIGRLLWEKGFVAANDGNISARAGSRGYLITASGVSKGQLTMEDVLLVSATGEVRGGDRVSSEAPMHFAIYATRSDVKAVVHAHPPYATAFAVVGESLERCILPEVIVTLGRIPLVNYALPSSDELADKVARQIRDYNALLLENHGVVTVGTSLDEAYNRMERVEHYARILLLARLLGHPRTLSSQQVRELEERFGKPLGEDREPCEL